MTLQKAKQIVSENKLDLSYSGLDLIPARTVEIERFEIITNGFELKDNDLEAVATLLCFVDKNDVAQSFLVRVHLDFYYRDHFSEALELIEALKLVNDYKTNG